MPDLSLRIADPGDDWFHNVATALHPLRIFDGTKWRVFGDGPGAPLKIRGNNGNWIVVSHEGVTFGKLAGRVLDAEGDVLADRTVQALVDVGQFGVPEIILAETVTDVDGKYSFQFQLYPVVGDGVLRFRAYWQPNFLNPNFATITNPAFFQVTQANPYRTFDFVFPFNF